MLASTPCPSVKTKKRVEAMPDLATTADDDDDSRVLLQQQKPEEEEEGASTSVVAAASSTATATTKLASVRRMLGAICVLATLVMVLAALSPSVAVAKCIPADSKHSSLSSTTSTTTLSLSEAASLSSPPPRTAVSNSNGTNVSGADGDGGTELVKLARGLLWASVGVGALRLISFFTFSHTNKIRAFYCIETAANIAFCVLLISALMIISGWSNRSIVIASPRNGHHLCRLDTKGSLCGWLLIASIGISSLLLPFDIFELIDTRDSYTRVPLEELNLPRMRQRPKGGGEAGEDGVPPQPPPRSPERVFAIAEDEEEEEENENEGKKDCSEVSML
mgnify:CR=1 FL=1